MTRTFPLSLMSKPWAFPAAKIQRRSFDCWSYLGDRASFRCTPFQLSFFLSLLMFLKISPFKEMFENWIFIVRGRTIPVLSAPSLYANLMSPSLYVISRQGSLSHPWDGDNLWLIPIGQTFPSPKSYLKTMSSPQITHIPFLGSYELNPKGFDDSSP